MYLYHFLLLAVLAAVSIYATNDGLTTKVTWDSFSLEVDNRRVYIFSGEFHYARLPVPELWLDVFQKIKANGMNAIR
jgi:hypothetical protein